MKEAEGGNRTPLGDEESVGRDRERRVVVEAAPTSSLVMVEANLLLQILEVALDPPAQLGGIDQRCHGSVGGQGREPVFGRGILALRPFDQQPFFRPWLCPPVVAVRWPYAHGGEAPDEIANGCPHASTRSSRPCGATPWRGR